MGVDRAAQVHHEGVPLARLGAGPERAPDRLEVARDGPHRAQDHEVELRRVEALDQRLAGHDVARLARGQTLAHASADLARGGAEHGLGGVSCGGEVGGDLARGLGGRDEEHASPAAPDLARDDLARVHGEPVLGRGRRQDLAGHERARGHELARLGPADETVELGEGQAIPSCGCRGEAGEERAPLTQGPEQLPRGAGRSAVALVKDHAIRGRDVVTRPGEPARKRLLRRDLHRRGGVLGLAREDGRAGDAQPAQAAHRVEDDLLEVGEEDHASAPRDRGRDDPERGQVRLSRARGELETHGARAVAKGPLDLGDGALLVGAEGAHPTTRRSLAAILHARHSGISEPPAGSRHHPSRIDGSQPARRSVSWRLTAASSRRREARSRCARA